MGIAADGGGVNLQIKLPNVIDFIPVPRSIAIIGVSKAVAAVATVGRVSLMPRTNAELNPFFNEYDSYILHDFLHNNTVPNETFFTTGNRNNNIQLKLFTTPFMSSGTFGTGNDPFIAGIQTYLRTLYSLNGVFLFSLKYYYSFSFNIQEV